MPPATADGMERGNERPVPDVAALKAELETMQDGQHVFLQTDGAKVDGKLIKMVGGFGIQTSTGGYVEFNLKGSEGVITVPQDVDLNKNLYVRARTSNGSTKEYWSRPVSNFGVAS